MAGVVDMMIYVEKVGQEEFRSFSCTGPRYKDVVVMAERSYLKFQLLSRPAMTKCTQAQSTGYIAARLLLSVRTGPLVIPLRDPSPVIGGLTA